MKNLRLIIFGLLIYSLTFGQIAKLQVGTSISQIEWTVGDDILKAYEDSYTGYSLFAGLDYLDLKFFNLSSNIGIVRKGDKKMLY